MRRNTLAWLAASAAAGLAFVWPFPVAQAASTSENKVAYPAFPVSVNGTATDQVHSPYPVLLYRDITYFPMTWEYASALGLSVSWNAEAGLSLEKRDGCSPLTQTLTSQSDNRIDSAAAVPAPFPVKVNGTLIDQAKEPYPVLLYRNITYFPMTWRFAREEFNWNTTWDDIRGFGIESCGQQTKDRDSQRDALNLANGGQLAVQDGWIYMNPVRSQEGPHSLEKVKTDGSGRMKLSEDQAMSINPAGDWLYYIAVEASKPSAIYKIRTDGKDRKLVSSVDAAQLWVKDEWMYYIDLVETRRDSEGKSYKAPAGISRMKTDGSGAQKLLAGEVSNMFLYGEQVYFLMNEEGQKKLYTLHADGTGQQKLLDNIVDFIIADGWVYYIKDHKQVAKMNLEGSVTIPLYESENTIPARMTYSDGWLYFVSGGFGIHGSAPIERMRIDGTGRQTVAEGRPTSLYAAGDEIYFTQWNMGDHRLEHFKPGE